MSTKVQSEKHDTAGGEIVVGYIHESVDHRNEKGCEQQHRDAL